MRKRKSPKKQNCMIAMDREAVRRRNTVLENLALDSFPIRFPRLLLNVHFHYHLGNEPGFSISDHGHWHWEISRAVCGAARFSADPYKKIIRTRASRYLIIPPKTVHRWQALKAPLLMPSWQVYIKAEDQEGEQTLFALRQAVIEHGFLFDASPEQLQAEDILWQLTGRPGDSCALGPVLTGIAGVIIGDLLMRINPWPEGILETPTAETLAAKIALQLKAFLDENLCRPVALNDLESHFHFSGRHLNRIFQQAYHYSIGHYLRHQRIELSKCWLGTTSRSVKDIAFSLGYCDPRQFSRYFFEQAGESPSQYRDHISAPDKQPSGRTKNSK